MNGERGNTEFSESLLLPFMGAMASGQRGARIKYNLPAGAV